MTVTSRQRVLGGVRRFVLWLALVLCVAATFWCLNLVLFHGWAAYVPPMETDYHLRRMGLAVAALVAALLLTTFVARRLMRSRRSASHHPV